MKNHYERILSSIPPFIQKVFGEVKGLGYEDFTAHPDIMNFVFKGQELDYTATYSSLNIFYHAYLMKRCGEKIFYVESDLATMLFNTELKGVSTDMLKTPYMEQFIVLPETFNNVTLLDPKTGTHILESFYVSYIDSEMRIMAIGKPTSDHDLDDTIFYFKLNFQSGKDLKSQVEEQVSKNRKDPMLIRTGGFYNLDKIQTLFNFVLNIVLYTTSPEADMYFESWSEHILLNWNFTKSRRKRMILK